MDPGHEDSLILCQNQHANSLLRYSMLKVLTEVCSRCTGKHKKVFLGLSVKSGKDSYRAGSWSGGGVLQVHRASEGTPGLGNSRGKSVVMEERLIVYGEAKFRGAGT